MGAYAKAARVEVVQEFYDAAVSGADPIDQRPGFVALLEHCREHSVAMVLVENASRFARDLAVQLAGHALLRQRGIELVPVDAPTYFTESPVNNAAGRGLPGVFGRWKYSHLQGLCPQRTQTLRNRSPVEVAAAV